MTYNLNYQPNYIYDELNEEDIMFITNPGRMGDEDGTTFIVKHDNKLAKERARLGRRIVKIV